MISTLTLTEQFSSAHLYFQPLWDEARNRSEFGRCFTPHGHGHNYRLEATFRGVPVGSASERTLKKQLHAVIQEFDHEHLNFVIPEFRPPSAGTPALVPTTENIALLIWKRILAANANGSLEKIRLFEMDDLWVEVLP